MDATHFDDEALSVHIDAALGAAGADPAGADPAGADPTGADPTGADPAVARHLACCAACATRRDALAGARALLAAAPVEPLDELTRRRLLATALREMPTVAAQAPNRARFAAVAGGVAAVLVLLLAVPFALDDTAPEGLASGSGTASDEASSDRASPDDALEEAVGTLTAPASIDLGDLGDLGADETIATLRERLSRDGARFREVPKESDMKAAPTPTAGAGPDAGDDLAGPGAAQDADSAVTASPPAGEASRPSAAGPADCPSVVVGSFTDAVVEATGTGTFEGNPAVVVVVTTDGQRLAVVVAAATCLELGRHPV